MFVTLEFSDISDSLETDAEGKVPTMHRQMESLVKAIELTREGQEDNAVLDDDGNDERGEDGDTTALRGYCRPRRRQSAT